MGLIDASIPASAVNARAFTTHEIDAHPDAARIWATVREVRDDAKAAAEADDDEDYD